jgi:two-component system sensor histidine kinase RegB
VASHGQTLDEWLESFAAQWRLRHPHVKFERIGAVPTGVWLDDTAAVSQILTILLDNAARASRDRVTLAASSANGQVEFEVCDSGPGIPPSLRGRLGSMPVDSTQGGHGVGLYLAFTAAARLGGEIELANGKPRGTRAVLRLPAAKEEPGAGHAGSASTDTREKNT